MPAATNSPAGFPLGWYIGGAKPLRPAVTRSAVGVPFFSCALTSTLAPGTSKASVPGRTVTTGTLGGTTTIFSPPLYVSRSCCPPRTDLGAAARSATVALVMVLCGSRSHGRCPSPVPRAASGNTTTSSAFCEPSACGMAAVPMKLPRLMSDSLIG